MFYINNDYRNICQISSNLPSNLTRNDQNYRNSINSINLRLLLRSKFIKRHLSRHCQVKIVAPSNKHFYDTSLKMG